MDGLCRTYKYSKEPQVSWVRDPTQDLTAIKGRVEDSQKLFHCAGRKYIVLFCTSVNKDATLALGFIWLLLHSSSNESGLLCVCSEVEGGWSLITSPCVLKEGQIYFYHVMMAI